MEEKGWNQNPKGNPDRGPNHPEKRLRKRRGRGA